MELNINYLRIEKPMKIDPTNNLDWTPIVAVFTIVAGVFSGFWVWVNFYFREKANQREQMLAIIVNKIIDPKLVEQDKQFQRLWKEMDDMRKKMDEDFREMQKMLMDIVKK